MEKNYRVHPGVVMKSILLSLDKNQKWLAAEMNMNKTVISNILNGKRKVTKNIAISFEKATGYPAVNLINAQTEYDLYYSINNNSRVEKSYEVKAKYEVGNTNIVLAI